MHLHAPFPLRAASSRPRAGPSTRQRPRHVDRSVERMPNDGADAGGERDSRLPTQIRNPGRGVLSGEGRRSLCSICKSRPGPKSNLTRKDRALLRLLSAALASAAFARDDWARTLLVALTATAVVDLVEPHFPSAARDRRIGVGADGQSRPLSPGTGDEAGRQVEPRAALFIARARAPYLQVRDQVRDRPRDRVAVATASHVALMRMRVAAARSQRGPEQN